MKGIGMTLDSNLSKPKGTGYYLNRIGVIVSLMFIAYSVFAVVNTIMDIGRHGNIDGLSLVLAMYLVIDLILVGYVRGAFKNRKLRQLAASMKSPNFFKPDVNDEQFTPAQKIYHGVDFKHGLVGVAAIYAEGFNRRKRVLFDSDTIESYELNGSKLILNLRNREVPTIAIMTLSAERAYRNIEMLCKMAQTSKPNRGAEYFATREKMVKAGWMLERDY